jgi:hypothetical protein
VRLDFSYTADDLDEWAKLPKPHAKSIFGRRPLLMVGLIVVAVLVVQLLTAVRTGTVAPAAPTIAQPDPSLWGTLVLPMLPWLIVFAAIWFIVFRQLRRQGRRLWEKNDDFQQPHAVTIDDGGIEVAGPKMATRFRWAAFGGWSETLNLFLLWQPAGVYTILPKRAMTDEQLAELRGVFRSNVGTATGGFPVVARPPTGQQGDPDRAT